MDGVTVHRLQVAHAALMMRGERPVRVWVTRYEGALLCQECGFDPNRVRWLRWRGLPVSVCVPPAVARIVAESGASEGI